MEEGRASPVGSGIPERPRPNPVHILSRYLRERAPERLVCDAVLLAIIYCVMWFISGVLLSPQASGSVWHDPITRNVPYLAYGLGYGVEGLRFAFTALFFWAGCRCIADAIRSAGVRS